MFYLYKFCLSLIFFLHFNEFTTLAFMPTNTVWGHNAVFADSKIYFTGGVVPKFPNNWDGVSYSKEFYYLDVKHSFKVEVGESLPWVDLSSVSQILPTHSWSALSLCGSNNDTLVMFGGEFGLAPLAPVDSTKLVYTYDITSQQQWNNPLTINQPGNKHSRSVCDTRTGKMYMFSGHPNGTDPILNIMDILNTRTLEWTRGTSINAPEARFDYTATLLPSGIIVYIGGTGATEATMEMSELPLYNINEDKWSTMNTIDYSPTSRGHHSAVLTKDGRIIVYGGYVNHSTLAIVSDDDLVILDTTQPNFAWSKAYVSTASPPSRAYHSATLVGDYMIVAFGTSNPLPPPEANEVFILDTKNESDYKWVNEFIPPDFSNSSPAPSVPSLDPSVPSLAPSVPSTSKSAPSKPSNEKSNHQTINRSFIIVIIVLSIVLVLVTSFLILRRIPCSKRRTQDIRDLLHPGIL